MPLPKIKPKLKADKDNGAIIIDDDTTLAGIPKEAWEHILGNRSAAMIEFGKLTCNICG